MRVSQIAALAIALYSLAFSDRAEAHDFWLQPEKFQIDAGEQMTTDMLVGHGPDRAPWGVAPGRVIVLRSIDHVRSIDRRGALNARATADKVALSFETPGVHMLVLQSTFAKSALPAQRFQTYARDEGLTPIVLERERLQKTTAPGRERYSRRAKTLVQVGATQRGSDAHVTRAVGLSLEIVPERNPYAPGGEATFPVRVYFEGAPLAGALVKLTDLSADARPVETHLTNASGRAVFAAKREGAWLLNVVWSKPVADDPEVDFETTFSSLTFGFR